jgi:Fe2+ transport system protein FeoA
VSTEPDRPTPAALQTIALTQLRPGQSAIVNSARLSQGDAALLGAMGLGCNSRVRLCRAGEPCIVAVMTGGHASCRIGLARPLADQIMVEVEAS